MYKTYIVPMKITVEVDGKENDTLADMAKMFQSNITVDFDHEKPVLGISVLAVTDIDIDFSQIKEK